MSSTRPVRVSRAGRSWEHGPIGVGREPVCPGKELHVAFRGWLCVLLPWQPRAAQAPLALSFPICEVGITQLIPRVGFGIA